MKFEDLLMQRGEEQQKRLDLEEEVSLLEAELKEEQALNRILRFALQGPISSRPSLCSSVPPQVQVFLEELAMVQEEILWLERKVEDLKLSLYEERERSREREMEHLTRIPEDGYLTYLRCGPEIRSSVLNVQRSRSENRDHEFRKERIIKERRSSLGSVSEILSMSSTRSSGKLKFLSKKNVHKPRANTRGRESKRPSARSSFEISLT
ncbi:hypothetical protein F2P56_028462 [Juglans regia]|uniref:Uncharacterized protein LOC108981578 n=2 Tax=Juglans regia TaxID=51240 RepID=A0A2I4DMH7_JUGRE|nr:uncharacterized protein LOC108981578 [Juglans regia]KAF5453564.1 hypothetical protein F2P56_028462 [Juglans regia]